MTRSKDLGTRWETNCVIAAQNRGLMSERVHEGGVYDKADLRIWAEDVWWIEAKYTCDATLNPHAVLQKAIHKSQRPFTTALLWRRMERGDRQRATQVGPPLAFVQIPAWTAYLHAPKDWLSVHADAYSIHNAPSYPVLWIRKTGAPAVVATTRDHFLDLLWETTT